MRVRLHSATGLWLSGIVVLMAGWVLPVLAGEEQTTSATNGTRPVQFTTPGGVQKATPASATVLSAAEVLKLMGGGVSQEVIKSYVESAPMVRQPSPEELIALKQHGVADEITTALIKRSAETRAAHAEMVNRFMGQLRGQNGHSPGGLDPESYEYFQHYYLFPRTLSSVYDRLYSGWPPSIHPPPAPYPYWW